MVKAVLNVVEVLNLDDVLFNQFFNQKNMKWNERRFVSRFLKLVFICCYGIILLFGVLFLIQIGIDLVEGMDKNELVVHSIFITYFSLAIWLFRWGVLEMKDGSFEKNPFHFSWLLLMILVAPFIYAMEVFVHAAFGLSG